MFLDLTETGSQVINNDGQGEMACAFISPNELMEEHPWGQSNSGADKVTEPKRMEKDGLLLKGLWLLCWMEERIFCCVVFK